MPIEFLIAILEQHPHRRSDRCLTTGVLDRPIIHDEGAPGQKTATGNRCAFKPFEDLIAKGVAPGPTQNVLLTRLGLENHRKTPAF